MTLTRATLGQLAKRQTKEVRIGGHVAKIQRPTPLEYSHYQTQLVSKDGSADITKFADAIRLLTARMWIDDGGQRLFADTELTELGSIDLSFYQELSAACQLFASGDREDKQALGESVETTD